MSNKDRHLMGTQAVAQAPSIDRIREAALRVFAEKGYHAASVRDITSACGIVPAAMYNHFPSKAALLHDLIGQAQETLDGYVARGFAEAGSGATDRLQAFVWATAFFHADKVEIATVANREYRSLPEPHRSAVTTLRRKFGTTLEDILKSGVRSGEFNLPIVAGNQETRLTAISILAAVNHITDWYRPTKRLSPKQIADFYVTWVSFVVGRTSGWADGSR